ncbi:hypothetical protein N7448_003092 [Penicillium atrosanguineum]|uniref:Xylanolytic transcriptional activator regulatory domain-containing protein n=1 Tax=Penicillium atrosanguineum TaxID=1132637 RepID=A0A9W9PX68_9EURO|nr:uncharacterized protein N7443_002066 [Penicillium atrosanguineum]KAJ5139684.1 hypothetical protein N7448_003092 [Penicillium atrosanguineum]KAJ5309605.1 hypothetical protein N7443_002066 [Penicillium atrosanguineum]KAJ5315129.1 hypothetical protein N7476_005436 [Penicillium atrosanguineum]
MHLSVDELSLREPVWNAAGGKPNVLELNPAPGVWLARSNVSFLKPAGGAEMKRATQTNKEGQSRSLKTLAIDGTKDDCEALVKILFPHSPVESLRGMSRAALLERATIEGDYSPVTSHQSSSATSPDMTSSNKPRSAPHLEANEGLFKLQCQDSIVFDWDETSPETRQGVEDDVNALSFFQEQRSSFVDAAVKDLRRSLPARIMEGDHIVSKDPSPNEFSHTPQIIPSSTPSRVSSYPEEQRLIDEYFAGIHIFAPIIHEPSFRNKYSTRQDSPDRSWLALLNMVLALGSVTSSAGDSTDDYQYYLLANQYLSLASLGSGRLETLQALMLMGGQYLHFRNQPHMASAIIGACYRIASSLGLHLRGSEDIEGRINLQGEVKRRNWWSIYVLDTWGSMTLGRPPVPLGILIDPPKNIIDDQRGEVPPTEPTIHAPLIHNIQLCNIMNRIQDRLIVNPMLEYEEIQFFDETLVDWFQSLPPFLRSNDFNAPSLQDARLVLKWRYQNIRFLLHRPLLLDTVIRRAPLQSLPTKDQIIISKCRNIAADSIFSIQAEWRPTKLCCWNAVFFLFQACLIPLLALTVESSDHCEYQSWYSQVQIGISLCGTMSQLSPIGQKTEAFLEQLFFTVINTPSSMSHYLVSTTLQPPAETLMGLFADDWDYFNETNAFAQLDCSDISCFEPQFLPQHQQPFS